MELDIKSAKALVVGGSRGLGAAVAKVLADEGASVVVVARDRASLSERASSLGATGVVGDIATPDGPSALVAAAVEELGGLDLLLVNGGGPPAGTFEDLGDREWVQAVEGTLYGSLRLVRAALPHLRESGRPSILFILSSSVRIPIPGLVTSNVLRPGLAGLVKSLAYELAPVRVNGIAPGKISSERVYDLDVQRAAAAGIGIEELRTRVCATIPLGRYGEPLELGRAAAFMLSPAASYITGQVLLVDGGMANSLP